MDAALGDADVVVERRIVNHRTAGAPIEPRAVPRRLPRGRRSTLYIDDARSRTSSALVHRGRARHLRGRSPRHRARRRRRLRRQAAALRRGGPRRAWASRKLGRPVKWTETRSEHMSCDASTAATRSTTSRRRQARRHDHRHPRARSIARPRRLPPAAHAVHPVASPAFVMGGCYKIPNRPARHRRASSRTSSRPTRSAAPGGPRRRT